METPTGKAVPNNENDGSSTPIRRSASIGILTYRRPEQVMRCLQAVATATNEPLPGSWSIGEILVVDNDPGGSARPIITAHAESTAGTARIRYIHEPTPGVATARNRALVEATGDALVFIDDDEVPSPGWPGELLTVLDETGAAMVGGPVLSEFTTPPPRWIVDGKFFDRDDPPHRSNQTWLRSGNLAIDRAQVNAAGLKFDPRYFQGEDSAFTRAGRAAGLELRWSARGAVTEFVAADRFSLRWRVRREYHSHRAWTRSSLDLAAGRTGRMVARARAAAIAAVRAAQGTTAVAIGLPTGDKVRLLNGLATLAGAFGRVVEIVAYRRA